MPTKSAICLKLIVVLSTSQTAVAFAIIGLSDIFASIKKTRVPYNFPVPLKGRAFGGAQVTVVGELERYILAHET
jgi:hypothetical protein